MSTISPQGYSYGEDPKSSNPFWADDETEEVIDKVTFSATADQTTGEANVTVTKSGYNVNFAFSGIKGETGATGATGADGATGATGPQGEPGKDGTNGTDGISPVVVSTGSTASGESAGTITGADGTVITVYNGAKGETGPQGDPGPAGSTEGLVSDVSVTNTDGVYTVSQTKDGATTDIGSIEVPSTDNLLAEVTDSVVENTTAGYDYHTVKETENNGTQNDVGSFYIARKQITALNSDGSFTTVDQSGIEGTGQISGLSTPEYTLYSAGQSTYTGTVSDKELFEVGLQSLQATYHTADDSTAQTIYFPVLRLFTGYYDGNTAGIVGLLQNLADGFFMKAYCDSLGNSTFIMASSGTLTLYADIRIVSSSDQYIIDSVSAEMYVLQIGDFS